MRTAVWIANVGRGALACAALAGCLLPAASAGGAAAGPVPEVIFSGRFLTLDPARPRAEALAVAGGRIVAAGDGATVDALAGPGTRRVEVPGVALPGLADGHAHVTGLGEQLEVLDLRGLSKREILERIAAATRETPAGAWILGRGWDQGFWRPAVFPEAADLDAAAPDHPVALTRIDSHSVWLNSRALAAAGLTAATADPEGGRILRDARGRPTGILVDRAMEAVHRVLPAPDRARREQRVRAALRQYARWGLTSVHDAGADLETIAIYKDLLDAGALPVRLYVMAQGSGETLDRYLAQGPQVDPDGRLDVRSFKVMLDGALGSRGAQLAEPYADAPGERGLELLGDAALDRIVRDATKRGFQVNAHAIGDLAIRRALDAFERGGVTPAQRFRIEHVSVLAPADLPRFARLGIIASMQPNFVGEYARWAEDRVGPARVRWVYPTRALLDSGATIAAGSDYPAADSGSPITTLYCLATRRGARGEPEGGWFPDQRVPVGAALHAMTAAVAFAAFREEDLGRLAPGRLADFTALSADPHDTPADDLRSLDVLMTVVSGQVVYQSTAASGSRRTSQAR